MDENLRTKLPLISGRAQQTRHRSLTFTE